MNNESGNICYICNTKSRKYFVKFNKDGSITWTDRCTNPNCKTYNKYVQT